MEYLQNYLNVVHYFTQTEAAFLNSYRVLAGAYIAFRKLMICMMVWFFTVHPYCG